MNPVYAKICLCILLYFTEATRERAFNLVGQAFSSINADDFAAYVGLPVNEAIQGTFIIVQGIS